MQLFNFHRYILHIKRSILILSAVVFFVSASCNDKEFKKSIIEESVNLDYASYSLCIRAMSDGKNKTSGKNVRDCKDIMDEIKKDKNIFRKKALLKGCIKYVNNPVMCFIKIYNLDKMKEFIIKKGVNHETSISNEKQP